jgi:hypothetical protein
MGRLVKGWFSHALVAIGLLTLGLLHVTAVWAQGVVVVDFVQV